MLALRIPARVIHAVCLQTWLEIVRAGSRIDVTRTVLGGAAIFAWFSPILRTAQRCLHVHECGAPVHRWRSPLFNAAPPCFRWNGMTRTMHRSAPHDYWWPRDKCRDALVEEAKATGSFAAPMRLALCLEHLCSHAIGESGDLIDDPVATTQGTRIELRTRLTWWSP